MRREIGDKWFAMVDLDPANLERVPAFEALRRLAARALGVQLVLVDSDGALAHRRGGVLEAVSAPCRAALFTPAGFARCDAFYEARGAACAGDASEGHDTACPFGLSSRSVRLAGGLGLVASGFQRSGLPGPEWSRLVEIGVEPSEEYATAAAAELGQEGMRLLDGLLDACRESLEAATSEPRAAKASSPRMKTVEEMLARYAKSNALVLLTGETGSGKHHAARSLHAASSAPGAPFVSCRLGAIQPELLEATLFGHTRGAFTDASRASEGLLGAARGGSLLLDEVGELPERAQALLLRLLAERRYRPLGSSRERKLEARLLATTRFDLREQVTRGVLREDLYYRLDVLRLELPPLRERLEDLPALIAAIAEERGAEAPPLSQEALRCMRRYGWPGNLHELGAELTRLAALGLDEVRPGDLSPVVAAAGGFARRPLAHTGSDPSAPQTLADAIAALERAMIVDGLDRTGGNRSRLAAELGVSRTTLIDRLHRFGLMKR